MSRVLTTETAVFLQLDSIRVILFVFLRVIISLLALSAYQSDLDSYVIRHVYRHLL